MAIFSKHLNFRIEALPHTQWIFIISRLKCPFKVKSTADTPSSPTKSYENCVLPDQTPLNPSCADDIRILLCFSNFSLPFFPLQARRHGHFPLLRTSQHVQRDAAASAFVQAEGGHPTVAILPLGVIHWSVTMVNLKETYQDISLGFTWNMENCPSWPW